MAPEMQFPSAAAEVIELRAEAHLNMESYRQRLERERYDSELLASIRVSNEIAEAQNCIQERIATALEALADYFATTDGGR